MKEDGELTADNYGKRKETEYGHILEGGAISGEGKPGDDEAKIKMHIGNMDAAVGGIRDQSVFPGADDIFLPYLDSLYKETLDTSDQSMFTALTQTMEASFFKDMDDLNVLRPDVLTRVTEYVPQIAKFVEVVVDKGFAYEADGSVYFDIAAFEKGGNTYARLRPQNRNDSSLQAEGEGSLSKDATGKRGAGDFALWKKSKAGEPYWPSRWGNGRPGWHIECSVMASDVLGAQMDIHSGGIDLAFPHHDNELAQSEAFYCQHGKGEHTWVNYFFHMGHLSISGSKMSKSLKNFQSIQDALATNYTPRSMRIVFLLGKWNDGVEVSPDLRTQADSWETTISNFFTNTKSWLLEAKIEVEEIKTPDLQADGQERTGLLKELDIARKDLAAALANSLETPRAMQAILTLVNATNVYIKDTKDFDLKEVASVARWITSIVGIFGLDSNAKAPYEGIGWAATISEDVDPNTAVKPYVAAYEKVQQQAIGLEIPNELLASTVAQDPRPDFEHVLETGTRDIERLSLPYVSAVATMRHVLRKLVSSQTPEVKKKILELTDSIRDHELANLGVYLDDRADDQPALIKFIPAAELIAAREEKAAAAVEKAKKKEEARLEKERAAAEALEKAKVPPEEMFKTDERYSAFDGQGLPIRMKDGSDVPKSQVKQAKKLWDKQKKAHDDAKAKGLV